MIQMPCRMWCAPLQERSSDNQCLVRAARASQKSSCYAAFGPASAPAHQDSAPARGLTAPSGKKFTRKCLPEAGNLSIVIVMERNRGHFPFVVSGVTTENSVRAPAIRMAPETRPDNSWAAALWLRSLCTWCDLITDADSAAVKDHGAEAASMNQASE